MEKRMRAKLQEIHLLRAFGALGVVLLHSLAGSSSNPINHFIGNFLGYVIPIFIFISGFALTHSYREEYGVLAFYKKRFGSILFPYLIFANLYYFYALHINYFPAGKTDFSHYISYILFAKTYYHMWFFVILFQLYLLFPFLIKFYKKIEKWSGVFVILTFILQIIWNLFSDSFPRAQLGTIFPSLFFYFALGMYFASNYEPIVLKLSRFNVFLPVILFLGTSYVAVHIDSLKFVLLPLSFVASFWMFFNIANMIKDKHNSFTRFLDTVASLSFGIYFIHVFCIDFSTNMLGKLVGSLFGGVCLYISALVLSVLACLLISKTPVSRYVIGANR
jgi:peptidoglycan/LPS O-acetylase OafA/YrhL